MADNPVYRTILTAYGAQRLLDATLPGAEPVQLSAIVLGDGNPTASDPDPTGGVRHEVYRGNVTALTPAPPAQATAGVDRIARLIVPASVGPFAINEADIRDQRNKALFVASVVPQAQGSPGLTTARELTVEIPLALSAAMQALLQAGHAATPQQLADSLATTDLTRLAAALVDNKLVFGP